MANNKFLQLFRSNTVYASKDLAVAALTLQFENHQKDGEPMIARYRDDENKVKTLLSIGYFVGDGQTDNNITVFDVDAMPSEVQDAIDALVNGASADYNTLKKLEDAIKAEVSRADAAEKANAAAIAQEASDRAAAITNAINALDVEAIGGDKKLITTVSEADGKISATAIDATAANIAVADASEKFTATDVEGVLAEIDGAYKAADQAIEDKIGTVADGKTVVEMIEEAQSAAEAAASIVAEGTDAGNNLTIAETTNETTGAKTYTINLSDVASAQGLAQEISDRADAISALDTAYKTADTAMETAYKAADDVVRGEFAAADTALKNALLGDAADDYNTLGKLEDKIQAVEGAAKSYEIVAVTGDELTALGSNVKEAYKLVDEDSVKAGEIIKIYKDSSLKSVALDGQTLNFTYILTDGSEQTVGVDVSTFLAESEFKDGLQVVNHEVSVKVDEASESFLTVSADGVKLSGVQSAITTAVQALDATVGEASVAEGKHVAVQVVETDGKITAVNVSEDDIASAAALSAETTARESGDTTINNKIGTVADGKTVVEMIEDAKKAATTVVEDAAENQSFVNVTADESAADGHVVYKVAVSDIASATDLSNEITRAKAAEKVNSDAIAVLNGDASTDGSVAKSVKDAVDALDVTDTVESTQYVSGVSETDGKITVIRAAIIAAHVDGADANDMLSTDANGSIVLSNTFDFGTY